MYKIIQRIQSINPTHLWLLAGLTLAFVPHLNHLPITIILFSTFLLGWRLAYELKVLKLPAKTVRLLLTLVALVATFASFHTLFGRQAGVGLLIVMLCLKLLEMKKERDVVVTIGLGYFVVITVFLYSQSIFIGINMLVVVILLTTALTAHNRSNSITAQSQNLKLACNMLLQAAPLMLLLFIMFPRIPGPLWSLPGDSLGSKTGLSDTMSPGNISSLSNDNSVAFRVQFDGKAPPQSKLYWRGPVLTYFDGKSWTNPDDKNSGNIITRTSSKHTARSMSYRATGEPVKYTVTMEPTYQNWLFALEMFAKLPPDSELSQDYEITAQHPVEQLKRYSIQSYTDYQLDPDKLSDSDIYLQLPGQPTSRIMELVSKWRSESPDGKQGIVNLALKYFAQQPFYYTRTPPLLLKNPVDEFLFETRRGFCEHYASSFVYLMRASGIPARVVTGYQGGESNPLGDYFIVRQSDAHAWSEVWLRGKGWIRVDPTSVIPPSRIESPQDLRHIAPKAVTDIPSWTTRLLQQMGYGWDNINHFWNQWILNYNDKRQRHLLSRFLSWFGDGDVDWRKMVAMLVISMFVVFVITAIRLLKKESEQKDPVVLAYQKFCRKLARQGMIRKPAEGATDFAFRACKRFPTLAPTINNITAMYQRLRYTGNPPSGGLKQLQTAINHFRLPAKQ
jgi:transglutaminase-like putative cysteine protease